LCFRSILHSVTYLFIFLFFYSFLYLLVLHSFPTRALPIFLFSTVIFLSGGIIGTFHHLYFAGTPNIVLGLGAVFSAQPQHDVGRSEEHTSELQSPYDLVCRLLLEKKSNKYRAVISGLLVGE